MSTTRSASAPAATIPAKLDPTLDADDHDSHLDEEPQPHEIATDPAMRCRYPSKHCQRQRSSKKSGALHSLCAFHRAKANRNQRRLEKRRRVLKDEERLHRQHLRTTVTSFHPQSIYGPSSVVMLPAIHASNNTSGCGDDVMPLLPMSYYHSPRDVDTEQLFAHLEPFRSPVPLFKEDLEELSALVDVSVLGTHVSYAYHLDDEASQSCIV